MAQALSPEQTKSLKLDAAPLPLRELAVCLLLLGLVFCALYGIRPPAAVSAQASAAEFSSERAMRHVKAISLQPHPLGSREHERVREYILGELAAQGLKPEVQETTVAEEPVRNYLRGARVRNVVARLAGTGGEGTKAVLLAGHYDSRPSSYGASDDGAAVAAMLETLRALKAGAPLKNDVIFLFTDGEELGMLGAQAFVAQHPWARDVGLALNFEARGTSGPAVMFETSAGNGRLVGEFAQAAERPVSNSLLYEVYRVMPNDTDLSVFKKAGFAGLNFAYIGQPTSYHTSLDNYENIDERSLQHQGLYALALTRRFGNVELPAPRSGNAVYFDVLGLKLIHYPGAWVLPLAVLVTLGFAFVFGYGLKRGRLTAGGTLVGALGFLLSLILLPAIVAGVWWLLRAFNTNYRLMPPGDVYNSRYLYVGFVALTAALFAALFALYRQRVRVENLTAGALFVWLLLLWATGLLLPGASYLFMWPLACTLPAMWWTLRAAHAQTSAKELGLTLLGATPGVLLLVPVLYLLFVALTVGLASASVVLLVLLLGLLLPLVQFLTRRKWWTLPYVAASLAAIFVGVGVAASGFGPSQPKQSDLFYGLDADTGQAVWASTDARPDAWSSQYLSRAPQRGTLDALFPGLPRPFLKQTAPAAELPAPAVKVLGDETKDGVRTLRLRVASARGAALLSVYADPSATFERVVVGGRQVAPAAPAPAGAAARKDPWVLRYYDVPAEGVELVLDLKSDAPLKLRVVDQSYGLPQGIAPEAGPRPAGVMPATTPFTDATLVSKSFVL